MSTSSTIWDCVVIGGGIIGLSTAYNLTKLGVRVLVLEQFHLPHTRGSSHGQSRLIRKCHDNSHYTALAKASYELWKNLEKETGKQLMVETGLLLLQNGEAEEVKKAGESMTKYLVDYECLSGSDIKTRYPMVRYSDDYKGVLDKSAAILLADACVKALSSGTDIHYYYNFYKGKISPSVKDIGNLVESNGGCIKDGTKVKDIQPGSTVTIHTNKGPFHAKKVVISTGPWSKEVLQMVGLNIPFRTTSGAHIFWRASDSKSYEAGQIPIFYNLVGPSNGVPYKSGFVGLFPCYEYSNFAKVVTRGEPAPFYCHPDERDSHGMNEMIELLSKYIKEHFPGLETKPSIIEPCMYCMTPDKYGIIDKHPRFSNIIVGTGFSGKGFMLAPVAGEIMCNMAMGSPVKWDVSIFSLDRFTSVTQSKL